MSEVKIMLGNEAIARGAFEAGVKVSAAYPGTPSTEISENIVNYPEIYAEWSPNEKVAMEVAIGASISGVRAMASMKHVGVNVASDPLYTISYSGVNGGLVLVAADDPVQFLIPAFFCGKIQHCDILCLLILLILHSVNSATHRGSYILLLHSKSY